MTERTHVKVKQGERLTLIDAILEIHAEIDNPTLPHGPYRDGLHRACHILAEMSDAEWAATMAGIKTDDGPDGDEPALFEITG